MMSLHKLTAGDGYEYLTRQVAAQDDELAAKDSLEGYYSERGEAPGRWLGSGLVAFDDIAAGDIVTSEQMKALWGEGRHPNATEIEARLAAEGHGPAVALAATKLGAPFKIYDGANDFQKEIAAAFSDYNTSRGEKARAEIPAEVRAEIRTQVSTDLFVKEFGRHPADSRELSGWVAKKTRQKTTAVAGYDLTFSPVKSVSALWAVAPREVSERIEAAHRRAVEHTLASIERDVAYTRIGTNGVARQRADGLIAAAFTHRDSRAGDPDLHTHVPISNKVRYTGPDGVQRWGALDGTPLHRLAVQASEEYNSRLEAEMCAEFPGLSFADRDTGLRGKRPVREIVGIAPQLLDRWSSRTRAIEDKTAQLVAQFQADHGREPTAVEHIALRQQANLATREAKHEPRSLAEQRATWSRDAVDALGSEAAVARMVSAGLGVDGGRHDGPELAAEIRQLEGHYRLTLSAARAATMIDNRARLVAEAQHNLIRRGPGNSHQLTDAQLHDYSRRALRTVAATRSAWQAHHVRAEAMRQARILGISSDHVTDVVDRITLTALTDCVQLTHARRDGDLGEPAALRLHDRESVFVDRGRDQFTHRDVLAAERRIVAAAQLNDGQRIDDMHVDLALLEHEANKYPLNAGQQALVREFATAGARFHLALAPAGTGKTSAMAAFTTAWTNAGGRVIGLAPTANAAEVLGKDIGQHADTLDKYAHLVGQLHAAGDDASARAAILDAAPEWFHQIGPGTVILIDEVGMSATTSLDPVIRHALACGADVKAVGDDQQLASVAAGGVLRDVADLGNTLTLTEVMRFTDPAEGAASLAVREGDEKAIGFYIDHQRVHVTADTVAADVAYQAWRRDTQAGHASVMLAPTLDTVRELNQRARADRMADNPLSDTDKARGRGRETILADGLAASAGDTIRTRNNDRRLRLSGTDFVRNGYRWTITHVDKDGGLTVTHDRSGATIALPADYVREHCELGYASTIHGAQGMTVGSRGKQLGTCRIVGSDRLDKQLLYVAMTRATDGNHLYLGTSESDPHKIIYDRALLPPTAVDMLRTIIGRDGAQTSATTTGREDQRADRRLARAAAAHHHAIGALAENLLGSHTMAAIDAGAESQLPGLTDAPAWPVLRQHLATVALDHLAGTTPEAHALAELDAAIRSRELDTADDRAAVLDWRLDHSGGHSAGRGPLPWLPAVPPTLTAHAEYGPYLARRGALVNALATDVRAAAHAWTPTTAPRWARPLVIADGDHTTLLADIAVFRAAHNVDERDSRPTGPDQYAIATRRHQRHLEDAFAHALSLDNADTRRWDDLARSIDTHLVADPFWPDLAERLSTASRAGLDVHSLLTDAAAHRALPTELPAAALWWRLADTLEPAVLDNIGSGIRVPWALDLAAIVGDHNAEAIFTDPVWPSLVAAVNAADPHEWTPTQILTVANDLLTAGGDGDHVRADEYARALSWRVDMLAAHNRHALDIPLPAEPLSIEDEEQAPADPSVDDTTPPETSVSPADAELPATNATVDDDYWDSLTNDAPPADRADRPDGDDLGTIDFDDLSSDRPAIVLDPPIEDLDVDELRTRVRLAHTEAADLHATILDPTSTGPAAAAAAADIAALQQRADQLRPALADLAGAHRAWVEADLAAEAADAEVDRLTGALAAATDEAHDTLTTQRELALIHATDAHHHATDAQRRVEIANTHLHELAPGGVITASDVQRARLAAERVDLDQLTALRAAAHRLDGQLFRAENTRGRRHAASTALPPPPSTATIVGGEQRAATATATITLAPPATTNPLAQVAATAHRARTDLAADRIRTHAHMFGTAAAAVLAADPASTALSEALLDAHRAGITPAQALHRAAAADITPDAAGLAHHIRTQASTADTLAYRQWHADTIDTLTRAFPGADHASAPWNTLCRNLYEHHRDTGTEFRDQYAQLTRTTPALSDAPTLAAAAASLAVPQERQLPDDNTELVAAARNTRGELIAAVDDAPDTWTALIGTRPTDPAGALVWDDARTEIAAYHARYGDLTPPPSTDTFADPTQASAHHSLTSSIDAVADHQRQQQLDHLTALDAQQHRTQQADQHQPPPEHGIRHHRGL